MTLAFVQYTNNVPAGFAGVTYGPWVRILETKRDDAGLLAHELEHVKQFWAAVLALVCWLPALWLYVDLDAALLLVLGAAIVALLMHKRLTLMAEVDAYRVQLKVTTDAVPLSVAETENRAMLFATFISTKYGLSITVTDALKLLTE
jgi:hypothetical protein